MAWPLLGSRRWYLYMEKVLICLDLECFSPIFSKGNWELDVCHHLVGGLHGRIVWVSFSRNVITSSDTCSAVGTIAAHPCQVLFVPASSNRTRHGLLAIFVQWMCFTNSYSTIGRGAFRTRSRPGRPIIDLVGGIAREPQARLWWLSEDACF